MKDIAQDLGVSLMTVSKALRNHSDIAEETRERVARRARELHYQPNLTARGLASRRSFLIGLIVPDMMHSFFAEIAKRSATAASRGDTRSSSPTPASAPRRNCSRSACCWRAAWMG
jgi:LacI family transcriptional regulator